MEKTRIIFNSNFSSPEKVNDQFTKATCYVCAAGKNRNGSYISEEAIKNALPTLWNSPIVAHIYEDEDGNQQVGGHDYTIEQGKDGKFRYKSLCVPFGVVPERPDEAEFVEIEEPDGRGVHTYLKVPAIIWTARFPEIADSYLSENKMYSQSMEIFVNDEEPLEEDPNYRNIKDFTFSALTLLGEGVEPCFPEAKVVDGEFSLETQEFADLFTQLKADLTQCFSSAAIQETTEDCTGNEETGKENTEVVEEQTQEQDVVPTGIPEPAVEPSAEPVAEPAADPQNDFEDKNAEAVEENATPFSATYMQKRNALCDLLHREIIRDSNDRVIAENYFYLVDFSDKFVFVCKETYTAEDYKESFFRQEYAYDEENNKAELVGEREAITCQWLTEEEAQAVENMRNEYELLVHYKADKEEQERRNALDAALSEFADLEGNSEFNDVLARKYEFKSVEELKNACYIIRGKYNLFASVTKPSEVGFKISGSQKELTPREKLHAEFGSKK